MKLEPPPLAAAHRHVAADARRLAGAIESAEDRKALEADLATLGMDE